MFLDLKDFYQSLSTKINSLNKSIHNDIGPLRYAFDMLIDYITWI